MSEMLTDLIRANVVLGVGVALVMLLRGSVAVRLGARAAYLLWAIPPLAALASLLPARTVVLTSAEPAQAAAAEAIVPAVAPSVAPTPIAGVPAQLDLAALALGAWLVGALVMLVFLVGQQRRFVRALGALTREADVFRAARTGAGPALVGVLRPRIVVPADFEQRFSEGERAIVIAHERAHLRAGDPLVNALVAAGLCLCWFNPLAHLAAHFLRVDQELACDAAVIARRPAARKAYAEAMLKTQGLAPGAPLACAWPSHPIKQRIAMLRSPTPTRTARIAGGAVTAGLAALAGLTAWAAQPANIELRPAPQTEEARFIAQQLAERRAIMAMRDPNVSRKARTLGYGLIEAIDEGYPANIRGYIEAGADVNHFQPGDGTPLVVAARLGDVQTGRLLLAKGARVDKPAPGDGSPLIMAAAHGRLEMVRLLVEAGADVNQYVKYDETPLINAARHGNLSVVRYLVEKGADPNLAVPSGNAPGEMRSPLSMAANPLVAQYLRSRGARR